MPSEADEGDNDEVGAIDGGPEVAEADPNDRDPSEAFEKAGGGIGEGVSRDRIDRTVSDKTRSLLQAAAARMKEQLGDEGDEYAPALTEDDQPEGAPAAAPALPGGKPTPPKGAPAPALVAPTPSLDPDVIEARRAFETKLAELDAREAAITTREASSDIAKLRDTYLEKPTQALRELIKMWTGAATDDEFRDEVADLITDLTGNVLGVKLPEGVKSAIDSKRALRLVKDHGARLTKREQEIEAKATAAHEEQEKDRTRYRLTEEIQKPEHAAAFPYLAIEENSGAIVFEMIERNLKKTGQVMKWEEAAKKCNDYIQSEATAYVERRKHLLNVAPAQPAKQPPPVGAQQAIPQGQRGSRTLTNGQASAPTIPAPPGPKPGEKGFSMEAHRAASKAKLRRLFTAPPEE